MTAAPRDHAEVPPATQTPQRPSTPPVIERMLAQRRTDSSGSGTLRQTVVAAWQDSRGTLADGSIAVQATSCLLRPAAGDTVLAWCPDMGLPAHVVAVLARPAEPGAAAVLSSDAPLTIKAPSVGIAAKVAQISCEDLLTNAKNSHAVEDTRTETARVRVVQIGTDIRRATTVDDEVAGTLLQRTGTWISNTVREARFKARSFLFD